eukprot:TRINITY_DN98617_c0_g1_i1.p1 TRINITY_DN98617_c0_g1~~TRINITY_DN98617_c0_g1_i1.p1  ORF type:complete len:276 (-),score=53.95 TRINITY_DN98617_c0_g1_i1:49-789(-)
MEMDRPGLCASCTGWQDKYTQDTRRLYQEVGHLREAVQKLVDRLAGHMPGESLRSFLQELKLDTRLFTIHAGGDFYRKAPAEELPAPAPELEQVVAERDLAKMKLASVGRELQDLKAATEQLRKQNLERDRQLAEGHRRIEELEERLRASQKAASRTEAPEKAPVAVLEAKLLPFDPKGQLPWKAGTELEPPASPQCPLPGLKTSPSKRTSSRSRPSAWSLGTSMMPDSSARSLSSLSLSRGTKLS